MGNAKLIKALRCKSNDINDCTMCAYHNACYSGTLEEIAADTLEAAEKRIEKQQKQIAQLYVLLNNRYFLLNNRFNEIAELIKTCTELEAQFLKKGECDAANVNGDQNDEDKAVMDCSYCPSVDGCLEAFSESTLCPNCGAKMDGREINE